MIDFKFAYIVLNIPFIIIWILLFLWRKDTRKEMLIMSFLLVPFGTLGEIWYFQDYWMPESILSVNFGSMSIFLEDLIFSFSIAGISSVIYENVFRRRLIRRSNIETHYLALGVIILISFVLMYLLFNYVGVNSIYATSAGFAAMGLLMVSYRKDLIFDALISGVFISLALLLSYVVLYNFIPNIEEILQKGWLLHGSSLGVRVFNIPFTEIVWGFTWGMMMGPIYEFARGLVVVKIKT